MKTPEEEAREYAGKADESRRGFQDYIIVETKYKSFLDSYHSRDEEVKELREALKEIVKHHESLDSWDEDDLGSYVEIEDDLIAKAKQLLNKE